VGSVSFNERPQCKELALLINSFAMTENVLVIIVREIIIIIITWDRTVGRN
jgi:hypothetical protein